MWFERIFVQNAIQKHVYLIMSAFHHLQEHLSIKPKMHFNIRPFVIILHFILHIWLDHLFFYNFLVLCTNLISCNKKSFALNSLVYFSLAAKPLSPSLLCVSLTITMSFIILIVAPLPPLSFYRWWDYVVTSSLVIRMCILSNSSADKSRVFN